MKNKYQEALDNLSLEVKGLEQNESIKILQELVYKETPMKPLRLSEGDFCRRCKYEIPENVETRCPHCGQRLDWSD